MKRQLFARKRRCREKRQNNSRNRHASLRSENVVNINREMGTFMPGMIFAVMAMLAAVVGIGIAKANLNSTAQQKRDIENGYGAKRRRAEFSQCAQKTHINRQSRERRAYCRFPATASPPTQAP